MEVLGDCFAEKTVEHHFSAIKAHCRGRPCLRDGVTGTQKVHMAHAGKPLQLKEREDTGPALTHQVATSLAASAWEHCSLCHLGGTRTDILRPAGELSAYKICGLEELRNIGQGLLCKEGGSLPN